MILVEPKRQTSLELTSTPRERAFHRRVAQDIEARRELADDPDAHLLARMVISLVLQRARTDSIVLLSA